MGSLMLLVAFTTVANAKEGRGTGIAVMLSIMGVSIMLVQPRVELDFAMRRFRTYSFRILARNSDFKPMPKIDRIQVRDITYPGGREGSKFSWGDTYSYEVFLMSVANEKLVICERPRASQIRRVVDGLVKASKLPVRDVTKEKILAKA